MQTYKTISTCASAQNDQSTSNVRKHRLVLLFGRLGQTTWRHRLIWAYPVHTCIEVHFLSKKLRNKTISINVYCKRNNEDSPKILQNVKFLYRTWWNIGREHSQQLGSRIIWFKHDWVSVVEAVIGGLGGAARRVDVVLQISFKRSENHPKN